MIMCQFPDEKAGKRKENKSLKFVLKNTIAHLFYSNNVQQSLKRNFTCSDCISMH